MRKPIVAANWKMNTTKSEGMVLLDESLKRLKPFSGVEIVICPPVLYLDTASRVLSGSGIALGAQNMHQADQGAYTGEVSGPLLSSFGCQYVIVGHSERRQYFGETNADTNAKVKAVFKNGMTPILCVGESLAQRENNQTKQTIQLQLQEGLIDIRSELELGKDIVIAYEPIWAIGTGKVATPEMAQDVHQFIRDQLSELLSPEISQHTRIQYGGSVKPSNIDELFQEEDIDGALVGGASLNAADFSQIAKICNQRKEYIND
jgi:triosephosphate isomerase